MRFRYGTDIGLAREENQDAVRCEYFGHNVLAVVCDGMGGERAGKEAGELAVEEFFQRFSADYKESLSDEDIRKLLISSVSAANSVIYTRARFEFRNFGMGTTCVAAFSFAISFASCKSRFRNQSGLTTSTSAPIALKALIKSSVGTKHNSNKLGATSFCVL